jgi:hypothetical protein
LVRYFHFLFGVFPFTSNAIANEGIVNCLTINLNDTSFYNGFGGRNAESLGLPNNASFFQLKLIGIDIYDGLRFQRVADFVALQMVIFPVIRKSKLFQRAEK